MPEKKSNVTAKTSASQSYDFNTFSGVFVPSVLAIFGAVMFLILPRVLGGIGLIGMILIVFIAHSVSISTAFSLSAIATNIKVKGGGLYYLISRSLGTEFGGGLGIQLFLAQAVSIGFYLIAFAKGVQMILAYFNIAFPELYISLIFCLIFCIIAFKGARFVIKIQYVILVAIILSIFSIFLGPDISSQAMGITNMPQLTFWVAFAMFFPAVVGIDAGIGMSGDLKNPKKSLVRGTFTAIFFTLILYALLTIKLAGSATLNQLFTDPNIIIKLALIPGFVVAGILFATSSSVNPFIFAISFIVIVMFAGSFCSPFTGPKNGPSVSVNNWLILTSFTIF